MSQTSCSNKVISADLFKDNTHQTHFVSWQAALKVSHAKLTLMQSNNSFAQEGMTLLQFFFLAKRKIKNGLGFRNQTVIKKFTSVRLPTLQHFAQMSFSELQIPFLHNRDLLFGVMIKIKL